MDRAARLQATLDLSALRKERNDVAEWCGGLKHSSGLAWEDVISGSLKSVQGFRDAFSKAYRDFYPIEGHSF